MGEERIFLAELLLDSLPKMTNSQRRLHWTKRYREANKWKDLVRISCAKVQITGLKLERAHLTLTRHSRKEPDFDGLVSGFKCLIDGLVEAGVLLNDNQAVIGQSTYLWEKTPKKGGFVTIRIEKYA